MTLPASGQISNNDIATELGVTNSLGLRSFSNSADFSTPDQYSDFYGYTKVPLKTSLISCWEMDETSGSTIYDKHGSNNLTLGGTYTLDQSGKPSKSIQLNNGYANSASRIVTGVSLSISYWFNLSSAYSDQWSNKTTNYYGVWQQSYTTKWLFHYGDGAGAGSGNRSSYSSTSSPPSTGTWYHVVLVVTGFQTHTFYVNGSTKSMSYDSGGASSVSFASGVFNIGNVGSYHYVGQTAVWSKALSASEVSALYNSGNGKLYSSWV
jgi:hypothetical protein